MKLALTLALLSCFLSGAWGWSNEELELFDLVEEVNENFYTVMGVSKDSSPAEIRKAYRKLSLQLHPDKNDAEDAAVKFRQLVAIYEVLRDDERRKRYELLLIEGLPDWRQPVYYYRRVRKMGLGEMSLFLFVLITVGQYIISWAAYWEKKYEFDELFTSKNKKKQKKLKKVKATSEPDITEEHMQIPKPSWLDTLPFQLFRLSRTIIMSSPGLILALKASLQEWLRPPPPPPESPPPPMKETAPKPRRRRVLELPDLTGSECLSESVEEVEGGGATKPVRTGPQPAMAGGLWTDDDFSDLARLMKKYPGGTPERWDRIAEAMQRTVYEVTVMAKKVKDSLGVVTSAGDAGEPEEEDYQSIAEVEQQQPKKVKTRGGKMAKVEGVEGSMKEESWNQSQQKALEAALHHFPKGVSQRWDHIANSVSGKSKEECILRYKYLVDLVKKKKEEEEAPQPVEEVNDDVTCSRNCTS